MVIEYFLISTSQFELFWKAITFASLLSIHASKSDRYNQGILIAEVMEGDQHRTCGRDAVPLPVATTAKP